MSRAPLAVTLVALALQLAACDRKAPAPPPASASGALPTRGGFTIPATTKQLVTAVTDSWTSTHAQLALWQRTPTGWQRVGEDWPAVLGKAGSAWGAGISPVAESAAKDGIKKEGDMKSPAGVFAFRSVYGYADDAPKGWRMPYEQSTDLECIDDPASEQYTKIIDRKQVAADWQSAEEMHRDDALYEWVLDVAHNAGGKPGAGSCIFLHVWSGPESTTAGCTAMDKPKLEALLGKLDPAAKPLYVLLPRSEYTAVASAWGLPAL